MAALQIDCPGHGNRNYPKIMLIGERPGEKELELGHPFVGRAGKFLDKQLEKIGISRKDCYITNVVKSYAQGNVPPTEKEIGDYLPVLEKEIADIKPKIIVLLGKTAAKNVPINTDATYIELPHPSAAMRFTKQRVKFENGMAELKRILLM
jgi:uracil-DNA glycosylase family 4